MQMKYLIQSDKRWSLVTIGRTLLTLGRWGCTTVGISMLSSFYGCYIDPPTLAKYPGLFDQSGRLFWLMIDKVFKGKMKFVYRNYKRNDKAIRESILNSPKTSVLLEVRNGSHWVVGVGVRGNDYYCVDPIDGMKKLVLSNFGNITGSAHLTS